jgi:hypothetical protein
MAAMIVAAVALQTARACRTQLLGMLQAVPLMLHDTDGLPTAGSAMAVAAEHVTLCYVATCCSWLSGCWCYWKEPGEQHHSKQHNLCAATACTDDSQLLAAGAAAAASTQFKQQSVFYDDIYPIIW